jgi:hypothetical protein
MSSEDTTTANLTAHLRSIQDRYRRQEQVQRLEEVGDELHRLLLERAVSEALLDITIDVDSDLRSQIETVWDYAANGEIDAIGETIDELEHEVEAHRKQIDSDRIQPQSTFLNNLSSMIALNKQLEVVDHQELTELRKTIQSGEWLTDIDQSDADTIEDQIEAARSAGKSKRNIYDRAADEIFEAYLAGELKEIVQDVLDDDPATLAAVDQDDLLALANSDLGEHIRLQLG